MLKPIQRMRKLADNLSNYSDALCLLGLGSMSHIERADIYSDMDFFLIVKEEAKTKFIEDLSWLEVTPIVYQFKNTEDGHKVLYADGIYAEFAVFTEKEIVNAGFTKGIIYYKTDDFDTSLVTPKNAPKKRQVNIDFNINEALTNIYVGLLRQQRGEIANASTFIQVYAYNLILPLFDCLYEKHDLFDDPYVFERRIEFRYKDAKKLIEKMRQGYIKNIESARYMLKFLTKNFEINPYMIDQIENLLYK